MCKFTQKNPINIIKSPSVCLYEYKKNIMNNKHNPSNMVMLLYVSLKIDRRWKKLCAILSYLIVFNIDILFIIDMLMMGRYFGIIFYFFFFEQFTLKLFFLEKLISWLKWVDKGGETIECSFFFFLRFAMFLCF